jgi:translation initiation factor eIF-2B subunit epsilon
LQVFVFCCAHADQIKRYLAESKWSANREMVVTTVVSTSCLSAGEALRLIDQKDIIKGDFVLVSGDTVSNLNLAPVLEAHRARRAADKNAIMTMVSRGPVGNM